MLWAPSQSSSGFSRRRSSLPGTRTASAACGSTGSPRNASAAATARPRFDPESTSTRAAPSALASGSHSGSPRTTTAPGATTASFSAAIASRVVPSTSVWSSATLVRTTTGAAEDVRRVVAAAEPCLDDRDVDLSRRELGERGGGEHLELRRPRRVRADPGERRLEVGRLAVDLDALRPAAHVGRDVGADAEPGRAQQRRAHQRRGRLAVRPDDVDRPERRAAARRAPRAARASDRARTPPAKA